MVAFTAFPVLLIVSMFLMLPFLILQVGSVFTVGIVATLLAEVIVIAWGLHVGGELKNWKNFLHFRKPEKKKAYFIGVGAGLALVIGLQIVTIILSLFGVKIGSSDTSNSLTSIGGFAQIFILFVVTPFIIPLLEETLFRGLIYTSIAEGKLFSEKWKPWMAIVVSALMFSVAHFQGASSATDFMVVAYILLVGFVLGILRKKHDALVVCWLAHLTYNLTSAILASLT